MTIPPTYFRARSKRDTTTAMPQDMTTRQERTLTFSAMAVIVTAIVLLLMLPGCVHEPPVFPEDPTAGNGGGGNGGVNPDPCDPDTVYFQSDILPLLVSSCAIPGCHDAITHEEGIRMYDYQHIIQEVDPFDPGGSELVEVITDSDPDDIMPPPPHDPLTPQQIQNIITWIQQGAQNNGCIGACDTTNVTYSGSIAPLFDWKCTGCHGGSNPQGNLDFTTWASVNTVATDGRLAGAIQHAAGYEAMPPSGGMLPSCEIDMIMIWIQDGAPNN